jgi:hypothetical protein
MGTTRSRNYPALPLGDAIERARELYKQEGKARAPATVIVSAWGYNSLNGASLRQLSAVRQYGLLEGTNEGSRLSDRALALILEPEDSPSYAQALTEALSTPALFQDIMEEYGNDLPSDPALISYLVRKQNFNESAARTLIQSFRDSVDLVRSRRTMYDAPVSVINASEPTRANEQPKPMLSSGLQSQTTDKKLEYTSGNIAAVLIIRTGAAAKEDVELMSTWLELAKLTLAAAGNIPSAAVASSSGDGEARPNSPAIPSEAT